MSQPTISTRGYFDLTNGSTRRSRRYSIYRKDIFAELQYNDEFCIFIHGLGNTSVDAGVKTMFCIIRFAQLGYNYPVVSFSYDSDVKGVHTAEYGDHAISVGEKIAIQNGYHLASFIRDFKKSGTSTKIRLVGHSLGSLVIQSAIENLRDSTDIIESVHLFGASIPRDTPSKHSKLLDNVIREKIVNYYSPTDDVLVTLDEPPLGLNGAVGKPTPKYKQIMVEPENHRFLKYLEVLESFP